MNVIKSLNIVALSAVIFASLFFGLNQYEQFRKTLMDNQVQEDELVTWVKMKNAEATQNKQMLEKASD